LILGTYGVVLRWFGFQVWFSGFVIFQRVRRPTYPQDIHFFRCFLLRDRSASICCVDAHPRTQQG
jgi:hypothetical protein